MHCFSTYIKYENFFKRVISHYQFVNCLIKLTYNYDKQFSVFPDFQQEITKYLHTPSQSIKERSSPNESTWLNKTNTEWLYLWILLTEEQIETSIFARYYLIK